MLLFPLFFNCLGLKFHAELLIKAQHICLFPLFDNFAILNAKHIKSIELNLIPSRLDA